MAFRRRRKGGRFTRRVRRRRSRTFRRRGRWAPRKLGRFGRMVRSVMNKLEETKVFSGFTGQTAIDTLSAEVFRADLGNLVTSTLATGRIGNRINIKTMTFHVDLIAVAQGTVVHMAIIRLLKEPLDSGGGTLIPVDIWDPNGQSEAFSNIAFYRQPKIVPYQILYHKFWEMGTQDGPGLLKLSESHRTIMKTLKLNKTVVFNPGTADPRYGQIQWCLWSNKTTTARPFYTLNTRYRYTDL